MKKFYSFFFAVLFSSHISMSQNSNLYLPINIQNAINNGTRTIDGHPGKNYWQNSSDYKINATLLADSSYLIGDETVTYYNNSPDSLDEIVIRLYQDIAKFGAVRDWYVGQSGLNEGVKINYLIIDNDTVDISPQSKEIRRGSTNLSIKLQNVIAPKTNVEVKIGWEFIIPEVLKLRMGNYGNGNFYIAYWYPQIAVYDDVDGWDKLDYSGIVEFYNDFSNFDVTLNVPAGMVVWATGDLLNGKDVLREDIFVKYEKAKTSDETIEIINQDNYKMGLVTSTNKTNAWHYEARGVTDFSFATSNTYNWDGASVIVDKATGRRTLTDVVYKDSTVHYSDAAQYARRTIEYLSHKLPGYPYPYSHATSYSNGRRSGGMESPMMANNGAPSELSHHVGLIFHEISHNYFPFMMGTNERKYAWMDEGWASFLPTNIVLEYDPSYDYKAKRVESYQKGAGGETDLPPTIPSYSYKTASMRLGFYDRPTNAYYELQALLGEDKFKSALFEYVNVWVGKHPLPIDFFNIFNSIVGENLNWFWKPWFYEFGYPDLAIGNVETSNGTIVCKIMKIGNIPTRIEVLFEFEDGTSQTVKENARVWSDGKKEVIVKLESSKKLNRIELGSKYIPDSMSDNNIYKP